MSQLFEKPNYSEAQCRNVFQSDGRLAMKIKRENPVEYAALRAAAEFYGILGPQPKSASPLARMVLDHQERENAAANRTYSAEELRARATFSEADCRDLLTKSGQAGDQNNLSHLKKTDPDKYRLFKIAAHSHGLPVTPPAPIARTKTPAPDGRLTISDGLADEAHLPRGTRVPAEQLSEIIQTVADIRAAKAAQSSQENN